MQLQGQHVLILGLGASGLAMARWCAQAGADVTVADTRETPPQLHTLQVEWPAVRFVSGPFAGSLVEGTSVRAVFRSPGLAPEVVAPVVDAARAMGLWQGGELSLFAAGLKDLKDRFGYAPQVLAITGTNGKTTVTSLTGQLVARAGKTVKVAGNIGPTLLDTLTEAMVQAQQQVAQEVAKSEAEQEDLDPTKGTPETSAQPLVQTSDSSGSADLDVKTTQLQDDEAEPVWSASVAPVELHPMAQALPQVWVLELSSFQLDSSEGFESTAATVLNISQDHLDWHGSMAAYIDAKAPFAAWREAGIKVENASGGALSAGDLLCVIVNPAADPSSAYAPKVKKADADAASIYERRFFAVMQSASVADGASGYAASLAGSVGYCAFASAPALADVGKPVFLSTTAGSASMSAPSSSGQSVFQIGYLASATASGGKYAVVIQPQYLGQIP